MNRDRVVPRAERPDVEIVQRDDPREPDDQLTDGREGQGARRAISFRGRHDGIARHRIPRVYDTH